MTKTATTTATATRTAANDVATGPTGVFPMFSKTMVEKTTTFDSATVWTYTYPWHRSSRTKVRTITGPTDLVYWDYSTIVVTKEVTAYVTTSQDSSAVVTSTRSAVSKFVTGPTTITSSDVTLTITEGFPTTVVFFVTIPITSWVFYDVSYTHVETQNFVATTTSTPDPLPTQFDFFEYVEVFVTETVHIGGTTSFIRNFEEPLVVTTTSTITTTTTDGAVITETITVTETTTPTASVEATVFGGSTSVVVSATSTAVTKTVEVIEVKTISIGDYPVTERVSVTKVAHPHDVFYSRGFRIQVIVVVEIFEFFFFEEGAKKTTTTTVTDTVTVTDYVSASGSGSGFVSVDPPLSSGFSRGGNGFNVNPSASASAAASGASDPPSGPDSTLTYEIEFTVIVVITDVFYGFSACEGRICRKPIGDLSGPSGTSSGLPAASSGASAGLPPPIQFQGVTPEGYLITILEEIVYVEDASSPAAIVIGSQTDVEVITIIEDIDLIWVVADDDITLNCFRNGIELVFFTCVEVDEVILFAGDSVLDFDLTVCTQVILTVNNTSTDCNTSGVSSLPVSTIVPYSSTASGNFVSMPQSFTITPTPVPSSIATVSALPSQSGNIFAVSGPSVSAPTSSAVALPSQSGVASEPSNSASVGPVSQPSSTSSSTPIPIVSTPVSSYGNFSSALPSSFFPSTPVSLPISSTEPSASLAAVSVLPSSAESALSSYPSASASLSGNYSVTYRRRRRSPRNQIAYPGY